MQPFRHTSEFLVSKRQMLPPCCTHQQRLRSFMVADVAQICCATKDLLFKLLDVDDSDTVSMQETARLLL